MKHFLLHFLVLSVLFSFSFTSCKKKTVKVGFLIHSLENERWTKDRDFFVEHVQSLGGEVYVEVANNNQQVQVDQAKKLIASGIDVLVVVPIDQEISSEIVRQAHQAGIRVIAYDRLIKGCNLDFYISTNSISTGEMQARYISSLSPKGRYALITGDKSDNNSLLLFLGQMNILQPKVESGDITVVYSEFANKWTADEGYRHTRRILDEYGQVDAILPGSDALSTGVIQALEEAGLAGKVLVSGQDAELANLRKIISGKQTCTVMKPIRAMAQNAAEIAVMFGRGEALSRKYETVSNGSSLVPSILLEGVVVNKDNISSTVVAEGFYTPEVIFQQGY